MCNRQFQLVCDHIRNDQLTLTELCKTIGQHLKSPEERIMFDTFTKPSRDKRIDRKQKLRGDEQRAMRMQRHQRRDQLHRIRERELMGSW